MSWPRGGGRLTGSVMGTMIKKKNAPGRQAKGFIPLCIPQLGGHEWCYVKECLDTGWVSSVGSYVGRFETAMAAQTGRKYAVACASGTAALHAAFLAAGIKTDEEIIMPTLTFAAPAFAARYIGAWPVFMDVDPDYWQMDILKLADFLSGECRHVRGRLINRRTGRVVRAIVPVHVLGHPVDMEPLLALAGKYGLDVIEDAAESLGAEYKGGRVGSFGRAACFSFNGNKVITCGGGGMLVTDDRKLAERVKHLTTQAKSDPVEYVHDEIGYNYRLTNIQAAVGLAQLEQLEHHVEQKRTIAARYGRALDGVEGLMLPQAAPWAGSIWWLYTVLVDRRKYGEDSRSLMRRLAKNGIQSRPLWHPLHSLKIFKGSAAYRIKEADVLYQRALSLPSSVGLTAADHNKVMAAVARTKGC